MERYRETPYGSWERQRGVAKVGGWALFVSNHDSRHSLQRLLACLAHRLGEDPNTGTLIDMPDGGAGTGSGSGSDIMSGMALMVKLSEKFAKHDCGKVINSCSEKHGGKSTKPSCDEIKKSAQCFFAECPAIQGTDDATESAELLVKFAKGSDCEVTAAELQNNSGVVQRPVLGSLLVLVISALITKLLM
ncbi:hypothetical protein ElyMa_004043200 [Elysia marginata]|uniref:Uncharacterized protein n=1 Tax=Elysia marginata TaxID=1093978 RepID=A0AAV4G3M2_9GAST|nr:hypothetical protein ElyMa_004043200 [Elysia marginata]